MVLVTMKPTSFSKRRCLKLSFTSQQCQKEHSGGRVQLRDILSVPMQRILKYHLLLDKLVHETLPVRNYIKYLKEETKNKNKTYF